MNSKNEHQNIKGKLKDAVQQSDDFVPESDDMVSEQNAFSGKAEKQENQKAPVHSEQERQLAQEVAHWKDKAVRAVAEMENLRKRTQIDMEKTARYANSSFAKDLLPVADCMEQAMAFAKQELKKEKEAGNEVSPFIENLLKGVEMTHQNLMTALKKQQIEKIESMGKVFDPNYHKVIQEVEDASKEAGTIVQELQTGYTIGDRVLREAMVIVSKK